MNIEKMVYDCIETIIGVSREEFEDYQDVDLLEEGIFDSLCLVSLMNSLSQEGGKEITMKDYLREDYSSIGSFIAKTTALLQA